MSKATYWQRGETLDFTNATNATIEANTIMAVGDIVGVAGTDIEPGETGSLHIAGVFKMPKATASDVIAMGKKVYFSAAGITATASGNTYAGIAAAATAATDANILVRLG